MAQITITISADEDDLRVEAKDIATSVSASNDGEAWARRIRLAKAIAAALPKPRIVVRPGMVLRRKNGWIGIVRDGIGGVVVTSVSLSAMAASEVDRCDRGLDPDEWTVILDAEDGAA